ncbi:MAG: TetR family transcriptional regulator [Deltaproteobacteria bacterium]|nr:TetR family transcriptional regulator [Deltaproteobacteria bacterium]
MFVSDGFRETTVRDIAREAGVNLALINYHFGSKEDLYKDLLRARIMPMFEVLDRIADDPAAPPPQKVELLIETYVNFVYSNPDVPRILLREMTLRSPIAVWFAQEIVSKIAMRVFAVIGEAQREGHLRQDVDVSVLIPSFIGSIVFGVVATPLIEIIRTGMGLPPLDVDQRKREVKDVILNGVKRR